MESAEKFVDAGFNMYLDRLDQLIPACFHITKPYMGRKRGSI